MSYYDYDEDYDIFEDYDFDDYGKKKQGKGKTIAIILAGVLAVAAIFGVAAVLFKHKADKVKLIQDGLVMQEEAQLCLGDPQGIRFTANVTPELKKEVETDENKTFGFVIAPVSYFVEVDTENKANEVDWINAFEEENLDVISFDECNVIAKFHVDGTVKEYCVQSSIMEIEYKDTNVEYLAFAYVKTTDEDGEASYKYASYPNGVNYEMQGRSLAYLTAQALNECAVNNTYYSSTDLDYMKGVINNSVDVANGLENPTNDGSMYEITLSKTKLELEVGEEATLKLKKEEKVKVPVWWTTEDASIVTVKDGAITAMGEGDAKVFAWVAGVAYSCTVTVEEK